MSISPQQFVDSLDPSKNGFNDSINASNQKFNDAFTAKAVQDGINAYLKFNADSLSSTIDAVTPSISTIAGATGQAVGQVGGSLFSGLTSSLGISEPMFIGICLVGAYIVFIK